MIDRVGTAQTCVLYILYTTAIRYVTVLEGVLVPIIEPVLNPAWAFIFVGEIPGIWAIAGCAIILVTVALWAVFTKRSMP